MRDQSLFSSLLPPLKPFALERWVVRDGQIQFDLHRRTVAAQCPACQRRSRRVHSTYTRCIADLPVAGQPVVLHCRVRRFRCGNRQCARRTFAEQCPEVVPRDARRTERLRVALEPVGLALGGRPGQRLTRALGLTATRGTLLQLVRALPEPEAPPVRILGVDACALRRGRRYGTVLVDVAASALIDLLPERSADSLTTWLTARNRPEIICRDRGGEYARGARHGAPDAIQVADRFPLQQHTSQVLERLLRRHATALRACVRPTDGADATGEAPPPAEPAVSTTLEPLESPQPDRRRAQYDAVVALHAQGRSLTAIAAQVGLSRPTVRTYAQAGCFPERAARRTHLSPGTTHGE
jgi:transposase